MQMSNSRTCAQPLYILALTRIELEDRVEASLSRNVRVERCVIDSKRSN